MKISFYPFFFNGAANIHNGSGISDLDYLHYQTFEVLSFGMKKAEGVI
jgi:hypothetical protein